MHPFKAQNTRLTRQPKQPGRQYLHRRHTHPFRSQKNASNPDGRPKNPISEAAEYESGHLHTKTSEQMETRGIAGSPTQAGAHIQS